jgi:glycosyltransferase involved in cell wall biosynthesis
LDASAALAPLSVELEIVVCDDGSDDDSPRIVQEPAASDPRVRLLRHPRNRGRGAALRTALAAARGELVLVQDADLEYDPLDSPAVVAPLLAGAPVVSGSRFVGRRVPAATAPSAWVANRVSTLTANLLYGLRITAEATCTEAFPTAVLRELDLTCARLEFCPEVTAKLGRRRIPIVEVAVRYTARGRAASRRCGPRVRHRWPRG